ncbi:MAG: acyl-ACP--UDP-N-acetylglucosamine O-acyltransferase [Acetobacteraceae bacterium]|nr:acyl-ACP--UDP-N-acetylglucosamine O-acyltransferase [Acetobacteraceae bacterium]
MIDPSARVEAGAKIGQGTSIGPFCLVGPNVVVGDGCRLLAHVHVTGHTVIGARTVVYPFASLGTPPQSVKYRGGATRLTVGADCDIRESVTMNTGTEDGGGVTSVGDGCFFMAGSHVGHDCRVGSDVTLANNAVLGGHVTVGDRAFLGGQAAVHQFVRVGEGAMLGGLSGITRDVIPYGFAFGPKAELVGLNLVGLKRRGHTRADLHQLRHCFRALFLGAGEFRDRLEAVAAKYDSVPLVSKIIAFLRAGGSRPPMMPPRARGGERADNDEV